jgi:hypothetical protein
MTMLGLDPRQQQAQQQAAITAQQQHWDDELTRMLREGAQRPGQNFTSPWQPAAQIAAALKGRMMAGQNAQNYANLAGAEVPTGGSPAVPPDVAGPVHAGSEASDYRGIEDRRRRSEHDGNIRPHRE